MNARLLFKTVLLTIFSFSLLSNIQAQNCNSAARVVSDIWDEVEVQANKMKVQCKESNYRKLIKCAVGNGAIFTSKMVRFWNRMAGNSWAAVGPRKLDYNSSYNGNILGTTGRMYITPSPLNTNTASVTINEVGGKGKIGFTVCVTDMFGNTQQLARRYFNDTNQRKRNTRESRTVNIPNARYKLISVHMDGKSLGKSFKYNIRLR